MLSERLRFRDIRSTSAFRLTLLLGAVFLSGLIAMLALIYVLTTRELTTRSDRFLIERAESLRATPPEKLPGRIRGEIANAVQGVSYFALLDGQGAPLIGNIALDRIPAIDRAFGATAGSGGPPLRVLAVRTPEGETILLGRDISQIRELRRHILQILIASGLLSLIGMGGIAVALSLGPLRRVRDLQRASHAIAAGKLDTRMPIAGRNDELDQIAGTLNGMIEEVGRVIAQVKATTDAIAHDLRIPLTRVRAQLHHARQSAGISTEQTRLIEGMTDDLDQVLARFAALLRISAIEASARRAGLAPVSLGTLAEAAYQLYEPLAEEARIALVFDCSGAPVVEADEQLLFEAISNLLDNSIKFARSRVTMRVIEMDTGALLEIVDDGLGIVPEERDAVLLRFHRSPQAEGVDGSGLGLSIVVAILHLHGFTLELADAAPGLIARVHM